MFHRHSSSSSVFFPPVLPAAKRWIVHYLGKDVSTLGGAGEGTVMSRCVETKAPITMVLAVLRFPEPAGWVRDAGSLGGCAENIGSEFILHIYSQYVYCRGAPSSKKKNSLKTYIQNISGENNIKIKILRSTDGDSHFANRPHGRGQYGASNPFPQTKATGVPPVPPFGNRLVMLVDGGE